MRVFISLEIPEGIKKEIKLVQQKLEKDGIRARWVKPEICHLTLAFLGSITPDKIELVKEIINESATTGSFNLAFSKIGFFPNFQKARIIFLELSKDLDKIDTLTTSICQKLKKEKIFFDEKPFSSHITLGRFKKRQNLTFFKQKPELLAKGFMVNKITLVKSTLTNSGPIYQELHSLTL